MPNEIEASQGAPRSLGISEVFSSVVNFIREHVTIEEVILIGLIILLLDEPAEQEILIILLVYILLF
jgi:hypothetical protein